MYLKMNAPFTSLVMHKSIQMFSYIIWVNLVPLTLLPLISGVSFL